MNGQPLFSPVGWALFLAGALMLLVVVPALNLWLAPRSALHLPDYLVPLLGKYVCFALLALALDLIWGFAGILSLGHSAFFALGGYAMGMHLMREIGERSVYGHPVLPDFMVFLNWQELPWYWWGFDHFAFAALMVLLVPGMLALMFGWLAFRSRVTGVYFSIITQAMTFALMLAFFRNDMGFGGNNGLTDFKDLLGFDLQAADTRIGLYLASAVALLLAFLLCRWITRSRFGRLLLAIRDAENRVRFLGYSVANAKLLVWTVSAMLAGLAGALYVPQVGIINPSEFSPANGIEIAVWVAVGGRGALVGAILGAGLVNWAESVFTVMAPELWLFVLGGLFVAVTLFLPQGIVGAIRSVRLPQRRKAAAAGRAPRPPEVAAQPDLETGRA